MCRPIEGNTVRLKTTMTVAAIRGSSKGLGGKKRHTLEAGMEGMAQGPDPKKDDNFLILFEREGSLTLVASLHHTEIKGVELTD